MKKIVIILIVLILAAIGAFALFGKKSQTVSYKTEPLALKTIVRTVEASGTINPVKTVSIGSQVSGMISELYVDFN
ncbi:efflux transporter RND family MFP subunit, partial [Candidatus Gastranaerophilus sp. (ex Termes propinquus)]